MRRIAVAVGCALALALPACGGHEDAQETAREAREATEVTVESARPPGAATDEPAGEHTQATVESAETSEPPAEE